MDNVTDILARANDTAERLNAGLSKAQADENAVRAVLSGAQSAVSTAKANLVAAMENERKANADLAHASALRNDWQTKVNAFNDRMTAVNKEIAQLQDAALKAAK